MSAPAFKDRGQHRAQVLRLKCAHNACPQFVDVETDAPDLTQVWCVLHSGLAAPTSTHGTAVQGELF